MKNGLLIQWEAFIPDFFVHSLKCPWTPILYWALLGAGDIKMNENCFLPRGAFRTIQIHPANHLVRVLMERCTCTISSPGMG